jgi:iron complex outermembrane receptor protein
LLCTLLPLAWTSTAAAQPLVEEDLAMAYGDKATVSIATGTQQALRRAPAVATVITAADIAAMGAVNLDEVMETVPGVHVARKGTANTALYVMRGVFDANNPQILMLQNGIPMTLMFLGNKGDVWSGLPLDNVARIEIIRGPGSALYGADAYAGVINIITRTAADTHGTDIGVRAGSFGTWDTWVQHGGKLGPMDIAAYLRVGDTDGPKETIAADAQTLRDRTSGRPPASLAPGPMNLGRDAVDASLDLGYDKWRFRGGYKLRDKVGLGAGIGSALDPTSWAKSERVTADLSWLDPHIARDWGLGFTASYLHYADTVPTNLLLAPPGAKLGATVFPDGQIGGPNKWERQVRLSAYAIYSGFADHSLRFGAGHDDLNMYKTATYKNYLINQTTGAVTLTGPVADYSVIQPFMLPQRRKVSYAYIQDEWHFSRDWTLTAGVRHDAYSDVGGTTNPRLALVWDASHDITAKLLAGQAFRAPSFNELYGINNPVNKGNPALKPETNSTLEAAFSWQARKDMQVNVNYFRYTMKNAIRAVANTPGSMLTTYANSGEQQGRGFELETVWDVSRSLRVTANYSHQRSTDSATNTDAGYAPRNHLYARGDWRFTGGWQLSPQVNWVADRKRAFGDARADVPNYTSVDLTLRSERNKGHWDFAASIRNLFNATILEPSLAPGTAIPNDLPQAGRSFYLQATYSL